MSTLTGADADELERIARSLRTAADELDGHAGSLTATLRSVAWVGYVASRFESQWNGAHRRHIVSASQSVRDAAARLEHDAAEQRHASRAHGSPGAGPAVPPDGGPRVPQGGNSSGSTPDPTRPDVVDRVDDVLERLGVDHDTVGVIADIAADLTASGVTDELIGILTDEGFVDLLAHAGQVLDAGQFVVDTITDFAENPVLPLDERIVHSLADAAVRFGLDQGMEHAAEFLAGAATTALLPGFGVILAPVVGNIAGAIAGEVMDVVVDAADDAIDVVDVVADGVVAAYREVKATFGLLVDVAQAAAAVVGGAVDLAGDAAGAVLDAGGSVAGGVADAAGALVDVGGDMVDAIGGLFGSG
jgi:hypothetical protein